MKGRNQAFLLEMAEEVHSTSAEKADAVVYVPRFMATTSFPSKPVSGNHYQRRAGAHELTITVPPGIGLPYGSYARLYMSVIATRIKITKESKIFVGDSINSILRRMGKSSSGGPNGSIEALKNQKMRLLLSTIYWVDSRKTYLTFKTVRVATEGSMKWERATKGWESTIKVDQDFYEDVIKNAVPVDKRVLAALSHSPLAWDIYCWLTYRYFGMKVPASTILWRQLAEQFGCSYKNISSFKIRFKSAIAMVKLFYSKANYEFIDSGLVLKKSPPHVSRRAKRSVLKVGDNPVDK